MPSIVVVNGIPKFFSMAVPLTPPSVNHYVIHTRDGRHYVSAQAKAFIQTVALFARGKSIEGKKYKLTAHIYLGHKQRGDGDNFWKVIADSLVKAGVIHSDAAIIEWVLKKGRDKKEPRTEIGIEVLE